jgi:hypothetical protein
MHIIYRYKHNAFSSIKYHKQSPPSPFTYKNNMSKNIELQTSLWQIISLKTNHDINTLSPLSSLRVNICQYILIYIILVWKNYFLEPSILTKVIRKQELLFINRNGQKVESSNEHERIWKLRFTG